MKLIEGQSCYTIKTDQLSSILEMPFKDSPKNEGKKPEKKSLHLSKAGSSATVEFAFGGLAPLPKTLTVFIILHIHKNIYLSIILSTPVKIHRLGTSSLLGTRKTPTQKVLFASPKERVLSVPLLGGPCLKALPRDLSLFPPLLLGAMGAIAAYANTQQGHCSLPGGLYLKF